MGKKLSATGKDQFAQGMYLTVTQTAANTLTFSSQLNLGVGLLQSMAIVLHRMVYILPYALLAELTANNDRFSAALVGDNTLTALDNNQASVYDVFAFDNLLATAVGFTLVNQYQVVDLTMLPGGGLLVPADRLYLGLSSTGFAAAQSVSCRVWFTLKELDAASYLELAQSLRVFT